jgi:hypothetical protein
MHIPNCNVMVGIFVVHYKKVITNFITLQDDEKLTLMKALITG